jgi:SAM-dependent methyltransferase
MRIDRPDATYDWSIANHVIEHVEADRAALTELVRILRPGGILQVTVPTPATQLATEEFGRAVPERMGHWRGYGSDWPALRLAPLGLACLQIIGTDAVTESFDYVYFIGRDRKTLFDLGNVFLERRLPAIWWASAQC